MDDRVLDLTEGQKATKAKYPPITKKYECKLCFYLSLARLLVRLLTVSQVTLSVLTL